MALTALGSMGGQGRLSSGVTFKLHFEGHMGKESKDPPDRGREVGRRPGGLV